jgi:uncharacterized protein YjbI with pentapeptide repeats
MTMTRFYDQDPTGARFEHVILRDAQMKAVDLTGVQMRGVELVDVEISGELQNVVVNGLDIAPLIEAELNRRTPERAKMRPDDCDGFREAWAIREQLWKGTVAMTLPEAALHRNVDDERMWSGRSSRLLPEM